MISHDRQQLETSVSLPYLMCIYLPIIGAPSCSVQKATPRALWGDVWSNRSSTLTLPLYQSRSPALWIWLESSEAQWVTVQLFLSKSLIWNKSSDPEQYTDTDGATELSVLLITAWWELSYKHPSCRKAFINVGIRNRKPADFLKD